MTSDLRVRGARLAGETLDATPGMSPPASPGASRSGSHSLTARSAARVIDVPGTGMTIEVAPHRCFACGVLNEHGLHLELHVDGDRCWAEIALPDRFQGWDGIAHGGIICTILDEVMAWSLAATDNWGLTARMSVEFKRPVRLGVPVRGEGWTTASRRRIVETAAQLVDARTGELLATATGTYVAADAERKRELRARYRFRLTSSDAATEGPSAGPSPGQEGAR